MSDSALVWFRRDLRNFDHAALYAALKQHRKVFCAFVFDRQILDALPSRQDRRVEFIHASLIELDAALRAQGGGLITRHGVAETEIPRLAAQLKVARVYCNRDYEPQAIARDAEVARQLDGLGIAFADYKDQVIFERDEILTQTGGAFRVFTPYKNAWLARLAANPERVLAEFDIRAVQHNLAPPPAGEVIPSLADLGFEQTNLAQVGPATGMQGARQHWAAFESRIADYKTARDFPAVPGTSGLSTHLRFGCVSIRQLARFTWQLGGAGPETWLSELIWREFYQQILWHAPHVVDQAFKPDCRAIVWDDEPAYFAAWCEGRTGYPIVDAAMRQIKQTGFMHNRLRMIVASFLTKDLGIDWRAGERYFAQHLSDYELASNNGGWQWAASTGCDAQPYFRIFNPSSQSEKFDPQGTFIRQYLPELTNLPTKYLHAPWTMPPMLQRSCGVLIGQDYPTPIVDHAAARDRTLSRFKRQ